ncbi:hypothetical protein D3C73_1609130 [compost metagenome]
MDDGIALVAQPYFGKHGVITFCLVLDDVHDAGEKRVDDVAVVIVEGIMGAVFI